MQVNYMIIMECDQDKFNESSGRELVHIMTKLKAVMEGRGEIGIWQVTDTKALQKFKSDIRGLNHGPVNVLR